MEISPVKEYKSPKYPDKSVVQFNPNLLKALPERWKGNLRVSAALSSIIMMMFAACGQTQLQGMDDNSQTQQQNTENDGSGYDAGGESGFVAPLFIHGDGRGSFGCVSVAPPAFLSEEEAFQVVQEEAKKLGLDFQKETMTFQNVGIPVTDISPGSRTKIEEDGAVKLPDIRKGELQLDGYDGKNRIGFEFISRDDIVVWSKTGGLGTVERYDFIPAAEALRKGLGNNTGGDAVGIFYDPVFISESINEKFHNKIDELRNDEKLTEEQLNSQGKALYESYMMELKQSASEQLREQVRDFLEWLKAEGII